MATSRRVCLQLYPTDGRVGDVPSSRSPIYSFNICTASEQTATFTSPASALSEERGEDAEILLADCVSVAHLVRRQTEEPQRLHRATNGRMTTLLMNALIIGVGGGCGVGGSREEDGGAVYGFMTVFWCCSQTDAPLLRASLYNCRDTYFQHMLPHPLLPSPLRHHHHHHPFPPFARLCLFLSSHRDQTQSGEDQNEKTGGSSLHSLNFPIIPTPQDRMSYFYDGNYINGRFGL